MNSRIRRLRLFAAGSCFAAIAALGSHAHAQDGAASGATCWVNAKTRAPVPTSDLFPWYATPSPGDTNHAATPSGPTVQGSDFVRRTDGSWTNSRTGASVPDSDVFPSYAKPSPLDANHAATPSGPTVPGSDFVRVPCPPPSSSVGGKP